MGIGTEAFVRFATLRYFLQRGGNRLGSAVLVSMKFVAAHSGISQVRTIIAMGVVVAAYFLEDAIVTTPYHQIRAWLGIPPPPPNTLLCAAYSILVSFRLLWWLIIAGFVAFIEPPGITPVLRHHQRHVTYYLKGLAIGFSVMVATVLMIVAAGDAQLRLSPGSASIHAAYGSHSHRHSLS